VIFWYIQCPWQLRPYFNKNKPNEPAAGQIPAPQRPRGTRLDARVLLKLHRAQDEPVGQSLEAEVEQYLMTTQRGDSSLGIWEVCIPGYWSLENTNQYDQEIETLFPTVFALAMDILPIQASAVPCERVFSSGKETMTPRRNRISPQIMEALQILKFATRSEQGLDFTAGTSMEDELEELESREMFVQQVPEDLSTFTRILLDGLSSHV